MPEAVIVRMLRFRTGRTGFDVTLRSKVLPDLRARSGIVAAWAGRQGPEEIGGRLIVSLWLSAEAMEAALGTDLHAAEVDASDEISDAMVEVLPTFVYQVDLRPLQAGILRVARGRASGAGSDDLTKRVLQDLEAAQQRGEGPGDLVVAGRGAEFVMLSTWTGWSAIETVTGASISEPLPSKRMAGLEDFQVDHFELVVPSSVAP